ncbi:hypothetical protein K3495_g8247 [Podosphaera aphanis]|nr:hypothetical protein K3495_g8247 [Podosphaera aphanis]
MALPPKFSGHLYSPSSISLDGQNNGKQQPHTLELYLDYVCPFSAKMFNTVYTEVFSMLAQDARFAGRVQVIFRHQVQPWHPSSTLVHEAALAVLRIDETKFWRFSQALFAESRSFYDVSVVSELRNQTYARLATLASSVGVPRAAVFDLLTIPDKPGEDGALNCGNGVTTDLKLLIKMARLVGVHMSPTVIWDGVVEGNVSSSWTREQWEKWLEEKVV